MRKIEGFTLIELSIVLVIIGLVVGGILVGRNLIKASEVRATVTQIEKYNTAANAFREKYGGLPGDLSAPAANQFGFAARTGTQGRGDGNGVIQGYDFGYGGSVAGWDQANGETLFFWEDLSSAHLIEGSFTTATDSASATSATPSLYFPQASIPGAVIQAFSACDSTGVCFTGASGTNYFALMVLAQNSLYGVSSGGLSVVQAYSIDGKIDDGLPTAGNVQAFFPNASQSAVPWAAVHAASPSASTCYDTTSNQYSVTQSGGANVNCGLSFRFQ